MIRTALFAAAAFLGPSVVPAAQAPVAVQQQAQPRPAADGQLVVPANRASGTATLTLRFHRIASTNPAPGAPIVFLAGGPGDSGVRMVSGMPPRLRDALLSIADIVAFDQRGTGESEPRNPLCPPGEALPRDRPMDPQTVGTALRSRLQRCLSEAKARGIDVMGLTTAESADDVAALARALGAARVNIVAGSYGTHLALAVARRHPDLIEGMVLAGVEGPDDTLKLPSRVDAVLARVAAAKRPSLVDDIRRLLERLSTEPVAFVFPTGQTMRIGSWDLQRWVADSLDTGREIDALVAAVPGMLDGDFTGLARASLAFRLPRPLNLMNLAMDCASFGSPARLTQVAEEAESSLLGNAINDPLPAACDDAGLPRLPDGFRAPLQSPVRALLVAGTLDGRTPVANAEAVARGLPHARLVVVDNASHDLFRYPEVEREMLAFLARRTPTAKTP
jgi:pimeloyl-ACP methyl ester carboxylesterase